MKKKSWKLIWTHTGKSSLQDFSGFSEPLSHAQIFEWIRGVWERVSIYKNKQKIISQNKSYLNGHIKYIEAKNYVKLQLWVFWDKIDYLCIRKINK